MFRLLRILDEAPQIKQINVLRYYFELKMIELKCWSNWNKYYSDSICLSSEDILDIERQIKDWTPNLIEWNRSFFSTFTRTSISVRSEIWLRIHETKQIKLIDVPTNVIYLIQNYVILIYFSELFVVYIGNIKRF